MPQVDLVCLANSRKYGERCVAGYDPLGRRWLRPVSDTATGTLERRDRRCSDGGEPRPLDLLRLTLREPAPRNHQPENWLLARGYWQRRGALSPAEAVALLSGLATLGADLLGGVGDRVPEAAFAAQPAERSLAVVEPEAIDWLIEMGRHGQRRTRALFALDGAAYNLAVTDLEFELRLALLPDGRHPRAAAGFAPSDRVFLIVSLGEPFRGDCYKLVAAVIGLPG